MNIDLSGQAGFPLTLDCDLVEITTGEDIHFIQQPRCRAEMEAVIAYPDATPPDTILYWNFKLTDAGGYTPIFNQRALTLGLVLLPPGKIGDEFCKTHGHYHSAIPGSQIGYPEVYTHYYGRLYLLMQRRKDPTARIPDDCVFYEMQPGSSIMVPPGYAHILINPSNEPALMAGLYSLDSIHMYEPVDSMAGAAYYLIEKDGQECFIPNHRYTDCPPLRKLDCLEGTRFLPPDPDRPLWKAFIENPERYAFLHEPGAAKQYFSPEDQRL